LAIGIFSAAMIAVCGWRRVHFGRDPPSWGHIGGMRERRFEDTTPPVARSGAGVLAGDLKLERPKLWEVWTDRSTKPDGVDYGFWDNIMPLAVLPARCLHGRPDSALTADQNPPSLFEPLILSPPGIPPPGSANTQSQSHSSRRRRRLDDLIPLPLLRRHARSGAESISDTSTSEKCADTDEPPKEAAQVVVIIEMPSLRSSRHRRARSHQTHSYQGQGHQHHSSLYSSLSKSETLVETHPNMREDLLGAEGGHFNYSLGIHVARWPIPLSTDSGGH